MILYNCIDLVGIFTYSCENWIKSKDSPQYHLKNIFHIWNLSCKTLGIGINI